MGFRGGEIGDASPWAPPISDLADSAATVGAVSSGTTLSRAAGARPPAGRPGCRSCLAPGAGIRQGRRIRPLAQATLPGAVLVVSGDDEVLTHVLDHALSKLLQLAVRADPLE